MARVPGSPEHFDAIRKLAAENSGLELLVAFVARMADITPEQAEDESWSIYNSLRALTFGIAEDYHNCNNEE